jgi:site-specific DNA recombinase
MIKVAIYSRYSTDMQNAASVEDQNRICKSRTDASGWTVTRCYADEAISGASMMRPSLQRMLSDARDGKFEIIMSESLDRISRDQADIATIYKQLKFVGVDLYTIADGEINEMLVGLKGTMNSLFLKDLAAKTHRGLQGRAIKGMSAGGKSYGYDIVRTIGDDGVVSTGERKINDDEARIVRRIFSEYVRGKSPRQIAFNLNKDGIAGPTGKAWGASTINGNRRRGTGVLNNQLYVGVQIWNRSRFLKNPETGRRISRLNPETEWIVAEVPKLRIIEDELWDKVREYQGQLDKKKTFQQKKRPPNLFSYSLECGECGGGMSIVSSRRYGCSTSRNKGTCECRTTISQDVLEEKVLGALRSRLMDPELTKVFCNEYTAHLNRIRMDRNAGLERDRKELAKVEREMEKLLEIIMNGASASFIADKANALEERKAELTYRLEHTEEAPVYVHPNMGERYAEAVSGLIASLNDPEHRPESAGIVRALIEKIVLTPNEERTALVVDLHGDLAGILQMSANKEKGRALEPRDRLELSKRKEIEQIESVVDPLGTGSEYGYAPSKDTMVAGACNALNLPDGKLCKVKLVAGVGFEPTTFRL